MTTTEPKTILRAELLRLVAEASPDLQSVLSAGGEYRFVSAAGAAPFGWTPADLLGEPQTAFVHPDDEALVVDAHRDLLADGTQSATVVQRFRCKDGTFRWTESRARVGEVGGERVVVSSLRDIHERHELESASQAPAAVDDHPVELDIDLTQTPPRVSERPAPLSPVHSSEIATRQLPKSWRGYEPDAVRSWLTLVALAQSMLEDDATRSRRQWDESLRAIAGLRSRLDRLSFGNNQIVAEATGELKRATEALRRARRPMGESDHETLAVRRVLLETPLRLGLVGVPRSVARAALDAAAAQLARLENRAAVLAADNDNLRDLLLEVVSDADPR